LSIVRRKASVILVLLT